LIHEDPKSGYWAEVHSLPGCFSQGETIEETIAHMKVAIELHIEGLREDKEEIPLDEDLILSRVKLLTVTAEE